MVRAFSVDRASDGIATLVWNDPDRAVNVLNHDVEGELQSIVDDLMTDESVKSLLLVSGKDLFSAGGDLDELINAYDAFASSKAEGHERYEPLLHQCMPLQKALRSLETGGKPVAVAIEGDALGGGLEVCLATHRRFAADDAKIKVGFPEVTVGLLPGGGGTQRAIRLAGVSAALPLLVEGRPISVHKAAEMGLVDELVAPGQVVEAARAWLRTEPSAVQPWDEKKFKIPGGDAHTPANRMLFDMGNPALCAGRPKDSPGKAAVMSCVYEGSMVTIDQGLSLEAQYFAKNLSNPSSRDFMRTGFASKKALRKLARRPANTPTWQPKKAAVVGVGMMGAGIAYTLARQGLEVVMIDQEQAQAENGIAYARKAMGRAKLDDTAQEEILARLTPTTDFGAVAGADIAIEAVFESLDLKRDVLKRMEDAMSGDYVLASNTTSLLISDLAEGLSRPSQFLGMHFFSPVDRMELVEIICGRDTDDDCLARAMDAGKVMRKTPIVVQDSRGFYTSRVVTSFEFEGVRMLTEGVAPALIENAAKRAGMPFGPLGLLDLTALDLNLSIRREAKAALGSAFEDHPADAVLEEMVDRQDRLGRKSGKGFYDYHADRTKTLWKGLADIWAPAATQPDFADVVDRLLYAQSIETLKCMDEGVISDPREADVGAVLGWSYPLTWGGPVSFIDTVGPEAFLSRATALAEAYGDHLLPPPGMTERLKKSERFYA